MKEPTLSQVDVAIIGGGINGSGLAALAAHSGLSVILFEKGDFASGTSSKSTKLIHGGIRYLEQARFSLVFESLHERSHLLKLAPHLVHPLSFLLPVYQGDKRPAWMLKIGLYLYDFLAGLQNISRHQWFSAEGALRKAPPLKAEGLKGCGLYYDAQVNDARLVLENILAAEEAGARCLNDHQVLAVKNTDPSEIQVYFQNNQTGEKSLVTARSLVNASGPWANQTSKMISSQSKPLVRPTRGTHLVVPQVLSEDAVLITTRQDNRVIFVIPWRGFSLVGTTDLDDLEDPDKTKPTEAEIDYLLQEASRLFPGRLWDRSQVLASFSGLRPLAWADEDHASSVSREDRIQRDGPVVSIVGGKLTTYRSMALKALKSIGLILNRSLSIKDEFLLPGTPQTPWNEFLKTNVPSWMKTFGITESQADHLAKLYGQKAEAVLSLISQNPAMSERLHPARPEILAQVAYAVQREKALHLSDVLLRRLEIGYTPYRWGESSEKASQLMGQLLGWSEAARQIELSLYKKLLFPPV
jgi:glycerol-3-phosphate dehydrogenase